MQVVSAIAALMVAVLGIPAAIKACSDLAGSRQARRRLEGHLDTARRLTEMGVDNRATVAAVRRVSAQLAADELVPAYTGTALSYLLVFFAACGFSSVTLSVTIIAPWGWLRVGAWIVFGLCIAIAGTFYYLYFRLTGRVAGLRKRQAKAILRGFPSAFLIFDAREYRSKNRLIRAANRSAQAPAPAPGQRTRAWPPQMSFSGCGSGLR